MLENVLNTLLFFTKFTDQNFTDNLITFCSENKASDTEIRQFPNMLYIESLFTRITEV